ncbi:4'-phosphopantetheinyl transferase family protein [Pseudoalteromonas denitrificans]|uniref:4'-phosphopantetheinyl transferase n=1 Tax=Pseudoalteromonas denitrificans DSM 6059 TaxID=1123010 RepID=A0A1I1KT32_9GAMM|nr:4'-phosphopantetheinyl transferase superfamily protein [Pseudoalteromonas denitrificans]SFC63891.1 4'-phosphopantetheinyl transferase [Pseudoalteromonas denitrificans DSM 6059]
MFIYDSNKLQIDNYTYNKLFTQFEIDTINTRKKHAAKQEYIASRYMIKQVLSQYLKCQLVELETRFNLKASRLEVFYKDTLLQVSISISHSNGVVLVALSNTVFTFGVDIEKINLKRPFIKLAKHFYHDDEVALIVNANKAHDSFYRIWTLKEALAKTICQPISQLLSKNVFDEIQKRALNTTSCHWQEYDVSLISSHISAKVNIQSINFPLSL